MQQEFAPDFWALRIAATEGPRAIRVSHPRLAWSGPANGVKVRSRYLNKLGGTQTFRKCFQKVRDSQMGPFRVQVYNNFQEESQMFGFIRKVDAAKSNSPMRAKHEYNRTDILLQPLGCFLEPRFWTVSTRQPPGSWPEQSPHAFLGINLERQWITSCLTVQPFKSRP
jgi:hypothetical protein